jgi:GNAT superfamily N-acetyltransferase
MYDIVHYRSDQIPPDLAVQIISFFRVLMMDEAKGDERFHDPFAHSDLFDHFMVVERGMMISHADVSFRTITFNGETYRMACVGEVMTLPNFRGEGHGQRAVSAATEFILNSDADIGMLFTAPELEKFYGASGWTAGHNLVICYGSADAPKESHEEFTMMVFASEKGKSHRADFERGAVYVGEHLF